MRLPRRVPWASLAELDQVCSWIYADENDLDAKILAINRLSAWKVMTAIPHALESALSILSVIVQDTSAQGSSSSLPLRQAYAAAIIRLVNGLVDSLQLGAYARSISSIAAQLDLPAWLVELRHAATHEDLPSLEVLRDAARDAMSWLLHHYFIPALNSSTVEPSKTPMLRPLDPLLAQYKSLLKITTRDAFLRTKHKHDITKILRDIERWISEAKLAANVTGATLGWDDNQPDDDAEEVDSREWWALNRLCDCLLEKGGLVPVSKKKRSVSSSFEPSAAITAVWSPLLTHISTHHSSFTTTLISRLVAAIIPLDTEHPRITEEVISLSVDNETGSRDVAYELCAASWINWLINGFEDPSQPGEVEISTRRANAVASLVSGMGLAGKEGALGYKAAQHLLKVLCAGDRRLQKATELLSQPLSSSTPSWAETDLSTMAVRLDALVAMSASQNQDKSAHNRVIDVVSTPDNKHHNLPVGWRLLDPARDGWRPTPIGVSYLS
ncbi:Las1-like-domain-containing protein [Cytidiella melzeri]|nr:Las1-like-domain-containing protein [Cytidiella melzeri]